MNILGISAFYHDSAAAIVADGKLVAACQEERLSRIKHDPGFPRQAIDACLREAGLTARDVDVVAFYEKPLLKFDRVLDTVMATAPAGLRRWVDSLPRWFADKLRIEAIVEEHLGHAPRFLYAQHHESHAASAFFLSPFTEAATLTTDGVGEWTTNAIGMGRGRRLELLQELRFPHSLGLLYSAFTQYLGFRVNEGEYKVMGLAPYGEPRFVDLILAHLLELHEDGSYRLHLDAFDFLTRDSTISSRFESLFGRPMRSPDAPLDHFHMDVARSIQEVTERVVLAQARHTRRVTGARHLCLAGGVALNCVANGKLLASGLFDDLFIQPAAGDAGGAIGAALVAWHHALGHDRPPPSSDGMSGGALGPSFTEADIAHALATTGLSSEILDEPALCEATAALLAEGGVVGWVQGRSEFGPRALGHRSILADPRRAEMQRRVNQKINFREGFRPFAPAVPVGNVHEWFQLDRPSPYMLLVVPVADAQRRPLSAQDEARTGLDRLWVERSTIPAVTHVDGSGRVQTVDPAVDPRFHALLTAFGARTGVPVLMNTSFNLKDEPIVQTPLDAARTFLASGMDALVLGNHLIRRPPDRAPTGRVDRPAPPERPRTEAQLRTFGVGGGALLGLLASLQVWADRLWLALPLLAVAVGLAVPGWFMPGLLRDTERAFARVGRRIGHINATVLLGGIFLVVVTPLALLRRRVSGDPLDDRRPTQGDGLWRAVSNHPDEPARYERMFG